MDTYEFFYRESQRNNTCVSKLSHKVRRAILQEMRTVAGVADANWMVVPLGLSLGSFSCFHMLSKRKLNEEDDGSEEDEMAE